MNESVIKPVEFDSISVVFFVELTDRFRITFMFFKSQIQDDIFSN